MALIKCSECGKEISDKSKKCIHCGYSIKRKQKHNNKKEIKKETATKKVLMVILGLIILICSIVGVIIYFYNNNNNEQGVNISIFYKDECSYCDKAIHYIQDNFGNNSMLTYYNIDNEKELFDKVNKYFKLESAVPLVIINDKYIVGYNKEEINTILKQEKERYKNFTEEEQKEFNIVENIKNGVLEIEDTRTSKEIFIDYLKDRENATCTDTKCTYTFTILGNTDYYSVDFEKKTFSIDGNTSDSSQYKEYNYEKDTGNYKFVMYAAGIKTTFDIKLTFDKENETYEYNWNCNCSLKSYCSQYGKEMSEDLAEDIDSIRTQFIEMCEKANVDMNEL